MSTSKCLCPSHNTSEKVPRCSQGGTDWRNAHLLTTLPTEMPLSPFLRTLSLPWSTISFSIPLHVPLTGHFQNWKLHFNAVFLFSVSWITSFQTPNFKTWWTEGVTCFFTKVNKAPRRKSWLFYFHLLGKESVHPAPQIKVIQCAPACHPPLGLTFFPHRKQTAQDTVKQACKPGH